jgi:DNA modification methylase
LAPYSERMKKLLSDPENFYSPQKRPSGHDIGANFGKDNGGAIPSNLLAIPNTDSNSNYLRLCKELGLERHPARFPEDLPAFFIKFLTDPGDLVVDIFAGSNTTGAVAERLGRKWIAFDTSLEYLRTSIFRFFENGSTPNTYDLIQKLKDPESNLMLTKQVNGQMRLFENTA